MKIQQLFDQFLDLQNPYHVDRIEVDMEENRVDVYIHMDRGAAVTCPTCGQVCPRYDHRASSWRHLDLFEYTTILHCDVPRVECPEHGVVTMHVPWAEGLTGYTKIFEQQVIGWLSETTISAVSRRMRLNAKTVASMMQRAVDRGLARRRASDCSTLCVDETSFKKRHKYVTVISSPVDGAVIDVREGRTAESMSSFYRNLTPLQRHSIQRVNMDMWPAYISATRLWLEDADSKICFDRFHVMKMILDALDKVRRHEHKELRGNGSGVLTGSKYVWLTNLSKMTREDKINFADIRATVNRTSRAWSIKEAAAQLWHYLGRTWAVKEWNRWIRWARRSKLEPIKRVAATIREHLWGVVNAIVHKTNNGFAESVNAKIQLAKKRARGYRSFESFRVAILFYCGNLELNP